MQKTYLLQFFFLDSVHNIEPRRNGRYKRNESCICRAKKRIVFTRIDKRKSYRRQSVNSAVADCCRKDAVCAQCKVTFNNTDKYTENNHQQNTNHRLTGIVCSVIMTHGNHRCMPEPPYDTRNPNCFYTSAGILKSVQQISAPADFFPKRGYHINHR